MIGGEQLAFRLNLFSPHSGMEYCDTKFVVAGVVFNYRVLYE
jgi:hypothetical protein